LPCISASSMTGAPWRLDGSASASNATHPHRLLDGIKAGIGQPAGRARLLPAELAQQVW
jgi:hypothetical protein